MCTQTKKIKKEGGKKKRQKQIINTVIKPNQSGERKMELEKSDCLTSHYTTKL